jgi:fimbrial chaperone protein
MKVAFFSLFLILLLGIPSQLRAAGWHIIPIRLDFSQKVRSGVITLVNDSDQPISFNLEAGEWTQDETGKDKYDPTSDLIFFPKELTINPKEERVIRAGVKKLPVGQEKTYRLFVKELPPKRDNAANSVAIAIRFGVPVFVEPPRETIQGEITHPVMEQGKLVIPVRNTGNRHFRIKTVSVVGKNASGEKTFSQELNGWYLLANTTRPYLVEIPREICRKLGTIDIQASGDKIQLSGKVDVDPTMCPPQ